MPGGKFPATRMGLRREPQAELRLAYADARVDRLAMAVGATDCGGAGRGVGPRRRHADAGRHVGAQGKTRIVLPAPESSDRAPVMVDAQFPRQSPDTVGTAPIAPAIVGKHATSSRDQAWRVADPAWIERLSAMTPSRVQDGLSALKESGLSPDPQLPSDSDPGFPFERRSGAVGDGTWRGLGRGD